MPALMGNDFQRKLLARQGFALTFGRGELMGVFGRHKDEEDNSWHRVFFGWGSALKFWNQTASVRGQEEIQATCVCFTPEQDCWTDQSYSRGGQETRHESRWHGLSEDGSRMTSSWLFFSCCTSWSLGLGHFSRITSPKPMEMTQSLAQFIPNAAIFALFFRVVLAACCYLLA